MPVAIPFIALAVTLAGTAITTVKASQQAKFQAAVAKQNAEINEDNADRARDRAQIEAQDQNRIDAAIQGQLLADQAASGLALGSGSFALQRKGAKVDTTLNAKRRAQAGELEANRFLTQAGVSKSEAANFKTAGKTALLSGALSAAGSIAGSAAGSSLLSGAKTTA